jgi:hypothetical protein
MNRALEEHLKRMKELNERLNEIRLGITAANQEAARERQPRSRGPLLDVRNYRTFESHHYGPIDSPGSRSGRRDRSDDSSRTGRRRR